METILVVDDTPYVLAVLQSILLIEGYTVLTAGDGSEALDTAARWQDRIDLLITDIAISHMGCKELVEGLKAQYPTVKVLYVSGHSRDVVARFGIRSDAFFLQKPFSPAQLSQAVRQVLDGSPKGLPLRVKTGIDRAGYRASATSDSG